MKKMKGQVRLRHLKDEKLVNGIVDIKPIVKLAEETGVEYCFIEQDHSPDTMASTKTSIDWLKKNV